MKKIIILFALFVLSAGCAGPGPEGVSLRQVFPGEPVVPREANRLSLPDPVNKTASPLLGEKLRLRVITLTSNDRRLAVVNPGEKADIELVITILNIQIQPMSVDPLGQVLKKRLRITASIELRNLQTGNLILEDREIQAFREYSDLVHPIENDDQAREATIDLLALRIVAKVQRGWYTEYLTPEKRRK